MRHSCAAQRLPLQAWLCLLHSIMLLCLFPACSASAGSLSASDPATPPAFDLVVNRDWTFWLSSDGWLPRQLVFIYLMDPAGGQRMPIFSVQADELGHCDALVQYPIDPYWRGMDVVQVNLQDSLPTREVTMRLWVGGASRPDARAQSFTLDAPSPTPSPSSTSTYTPVPEPPQAAVSPTPLPVSLQQANEGWIGEYYDNPEVHHAAPALIRQDDNVDFDWDVRAPAPGVPADGFSARWTRTLHFDAGTHRFILNANDGARVFIDDVDVIEAWQAAAGADQVRDVSLTAGEHTVRVEMYDRAGPAFIHFTFHRLVTYPCWTAEYYANADLSGTAVITRSDNAIHYDWGLLAPTGVDVPADGFSARWRRSFNLPAGVTQFHVVADDGVRVKIDDRLVIDEWHDAATEPYDEAVNLAEGVHTVTVEYYENSGQARVSFYFDPPPAGNWKGEYFNNALLDGYPVFVHYDDRLAFDWGAWSPVFPPDFTRCDLPTNSFSVRWTRQLTVDKPGMYRFSITADDGIRFFIDGHKVRDEWHPSDSDTYSFLVDLQAGIHDVRVEYYEGSGVARIEAGEPEWVADIPTPLPPPTATPTIAATATSPSTPCPCASSSPVAPPSPTP